MFLTSYLLTVALTLCSSGSITQLVKPRVLQSPSQSGPPTATVTPEQEGPNLPSEMNTRILIEREENAHRKILETANQVGDLTSEIHKDYVERGNLSDGDFKKLNTVEKLAKRILDHVGGERVDERAANNEELSMASAVEHLSTTGASIKKNIITNTRFVVSASVIADSNELIHLAQFIRRAQKTK